MLAPDVVGIGAPAALAAAGSRRHRSALPAQVATSEDHAHPRPAGGGRGVDAPDARMGVGTAHEGHVVKARHADVRDIGRGPGDQPGIFLALDLRANERHRTFLSLSADAAVSSTWASSWKCGMTSSAKSCIISSVRSCVPPFNPEQTMPARSSSEKTFSCRARWPGSHRLCTRPLEILERQLGGELGRVVEHPPQRRLGEEPGGRQKGAATRSPTW